MKNNILSICLMLIMFSACQSEHQRQTDRLNELLSACEQYDTMPDLSNARSVLFYMERHGCTMFTTLRASASKPSLVLNWESLNSCAASCALRRMGSVSGR